MRQAVSMAYDRDAYIDVFYNVDKFQKHGLPVETLLVHRPRPAPGLALDPKGKDFGANAKYYKHDLAEAKKLLAAAGYANGFDVNSSYIKGTELNTTAPTTRSRSRSSEDMLRDIGLKPTPTSSTTPPSTCRSTCDSAASTTAWVYRSACASADDAGRLARLALQDQAAATARLASTPPARATAPATRRSTR